MTALACYPFRYKNANAAKDFVVAEQTKPRGACSTLLVGSAAVYLMVDTGQIAQLGKVLSRGGKFIYASLYPAVAFLGGMAFGQGLPADFLFSRMQVCDRAGAGDSPDGAGRNCDGDYDGADQRIETDADCLHGVAGEREGARRRNFPHLPALADAATCCDRDPFGYSCVLWK